MVKYKVTFDREACIGALACLGMSPDYWIDTQDGKVDLKGATFNKKTSRWELIIEEEKFLELQGSADVCPVKVIEVVKIEE